jgi:hypothetical protein
MVPGVTGPTLPGAAQVGQESREVRGTGPQSGSTLEFATPLAPAIRPGEP